MGYRRSVTRNRPGAEPNLSSEVLILVALAFPQNMQWKVHRDSLVNPARQIADILMEWVHIDPVVESLDSQEIDVTADLWPPLSMWPAE